jgi:murein DD-endopeptidase MepM/ murein hydrolase activator NlpD
MKLSPSPRYLLFALLIFSYLFSGPYRAQTAPSAPAGAYILYIWDNQLWLQSTTDPLLWQSMGPLTNPAWTGALPARQAQVFRWEQSPVGAPSAEGFGFHEGVWSPERRQFFYAEIRGGVYGLWRWTAEHGAEFLVLDRYLPERGYLVPLGWEGEGAVLLLERPLLHNLGAVRVWRFEMATGEMRPYFNMAADSLWLGRHLLLPGEQGAFLGFDNTRGLAMYLDWSSGRPQLLSTGTGLQLPDLSVKGSMFELYPLEMVGVLLPEELNGFLDRLTGLPLQAPLYPEPFLHWPLPDDKRRLTCYADSDWTRLQQPITCPALGVAYEGHEGTDISEEPKGLTRGTAVYAAAEGRVVKINRDCEEGSPACGRAYGNYIALEHALVVGGNIQTWYTGYAHLQSVLAEPYQYISDLRQVIGESGATGTGGPHLHFEVRYPHGPQATPWIDPYDPRYAPGGDSLWVGGGERPLSAADFCPAC